MKCHLCVNYIEMQTDPQTCDYVIVSGAQRKEERWDMAENEQILTTERTEKEKLETDAMYKLDHGGKDKEKLKKALPSLSEIQDYQSGWKDDFHLNSTLRRKFRTEKKVIAEQEEKDDAVRMRTNLSIPLLPEKEEDKKVASLLTYQAPDSFEDKQHSKRQEISSRSWFNSPSAPLGGAAGGLLHRLGLQGKEAAVAKALGSTHSPLIRKRTGPSGVKAQPCTTVSRRGSDPEVDACDGQRSKVTPTQEASDVTVNLSPVGQEVMGGRADDGPGKDPDQGFGGVPSLVPDYSDSGSDSEQ